MKLASAIRRQSKIILALDKVDEPVMARYAWSQRAVCGLYTESGLPVGPFRTDKGPIPPAEIRD